SDMYQIANRLQKFIHVDDSNLTAHDKTDYYLADDNNYKKITKITNKNLTKDQLQSEPVRAEYRRAINYVEKKKPHLTPEQLQAAAIFAKMSAAYQYSTVYIKSYQTTPLEVAQVSEHQTELPGIQIGTDSQRSYPMGDSMTSIIGKVSTEKQGLPD
ncbi:penicillin-binding protein 2, partial [Lactobacillus sp. XV13L]|nr:penicillin-binding protein 2 [Lactobacillus sp. XV13L]